LMNIWGSLQPDPPNSYASLKICSMHWCHMHSFIRYIIQKNNVRLISWKGLLFS
jgi:hypothetical protein